MLASVVRIGNSRGIRLPKKVLHELNIEDEVELIVHKDSLIIKGVKKMPRQGWSKAFAEMSVEGADKPLLPENIGDETFEWVW